MEPGSPNKNNLVIITIGVLSAVFIMLVVLIVAQRDNGNLGDAPWKRPHIAASARARLEPVDLTEAKKLTDTRFVPAGGVLFASNGDKTTLQIKTREAAQVVVKDGQLESTEPGWDVGPLNDTFKDNTTSIIPMLGTSAAKTRTDRNNFERTKNIDMPDLASYFTVKLKSSTDAVALAKQLLKLPIISEAYVKPPAAKLPAADPNAPTLISNTPDLSGAQQYFNASPDGLGIRDAQANASGSLGSLVKVADFEDAWNRNHEDLAQLRLPGTQVAGDWPIASVDYNHGTGVAGVLFATRNGIGVDGIVPEATPRLAASINATNQTTSFPTLIAALSAGDVLVLEQEVTYGDTPLLPFEWIPAAYDTIRTAVAKGVVVIEPAANGGANLDDAATYGSPFPSGKADSGAIVVGAGASGPRTFPIGGTCGSQVAGSRMNFSDYGARVNIQAWGECVATTSVGNLYNGGSRNSWYWKDFNGTSSASPIIGGMAAAISSRYKYLNGTTLTPAQMKTMLLTGALPQNTSVNPGNIGPRPNLVAAMAQVKDITPPTLSGTLTATNNALGQQRTVTLKWPAATDAGSNTTPMQYRITRGGAVIATVTGTQYVDVNAAPKTKYTYGVQALDPGGNTSAATLTATIETMNDYAQFSYNMPAERFRW